MHENKMLVANNPFDVSMVVTAHHEGRLAHHTMRSLFRAMEFAGDRGLSIEVVIVMDRPDRATENYFSRYKNLEIIIKLVDFGDLGLSRNFGISLASGKYIAILDADNLIAGNWLYDSFIYLEKNSKDIVAHPEYQMVFEAKNFVFRQISSTDERFRMENIIEYNYWDAVSVTKREIFLKYPYEGTTQGRGFGFEDWHWNCQTLSGGVEHHIVPNTVHFMRMKKSGSLLAYTRETNRLIRPSRLFDPHTFSSMLEKERLAETTVKTEGFHAMNVIARHVYRGLKSVIKPAVQRHHRLHRFARALKEAVKELLSTRTVIQESLPGPLPEGLSSVSERAETALPDQLPKWLIDEWREIHAIEPQLFPVQDIQLNIVTDFISPSKVGEHYLDLCALYGEGVSHVFLVPWLKKGGADLETLNYVKALSDYRLGKKIVVITTENSDSPWAKGLPAEARLIEFGKRYSHLTREDQEKLLTRVILQMAPQVVHNINSLLGYDIFIKYGTALSSVAHLYACAFCEDITPEGRVVGYPICFIPDCFDSLTAVFSDNQNTLNKLHEIFAFEKEKLHVHYQPVDLPPGKRADEKSREKERLDILWASRLDVQKRPDILINIAKKCKLCLLLFTFTVHRFMGLQSVKQNRLSTP